MVDKTFRDLCCKKTIKEDKDMVDNIFNKANKIGDMIKMYEKIEMKLDLIHEIMSKLDDDLCLRQADLKKIGDIKDDGINIISNMLYKKDGKSLNNFESDEDKHIDIDGSVYILKKVMHKKRNYWRKYMI